MGRDEPKILLTHPLDDIDLWEIEQKGYLSNVEVECPDGHHYEVSFFQPVRLHQELVDRSSRGRPWLGEVGLIVVTDVTLPVINVALSDLWKEGWFAHLMPIGQRP